MQEALQGKLHHEATQAWAGVAAMRDSILPRASAATVSSSSVVDCASSNAVSHCRNKTVRSSSILGLSATELPSDERKSREKQGLAGLRAGRCASMPTSADGHQECEGKPLPMNESKPRRQPDRRADNYHAARSITGPCRHCALADWRASACARVRNCGGIRRCWSSM